MDDSVELLSTSNILKHSQRAEASRRSYGVRLMLELCLLVGFVASLSCAIGLGLRLKAAHLAAELVISPECVHALGGGPIAPGGGMDAAAPKQFSYCTEQLTAYAHPQHGAYWREVDLAAADAMKVFGFDDTNLHDTSHPDEHAARIKLDRTADTEQKPAQYSVMPRPQHTSARHLLQAHSAAKAATALQSSLDIHTRSSSQRQQQAGEHLSQLGGPAPPATAPDSRLRRQLLKPLASNRTQVVIFDIDETVLSNMQQILNPEEWPWDKWVQAAHAPALQPMQRLYRALCNAGVSVAFITGRREAVRGRTMHNLETAGYGTVCAKQAVPSNGESVQDSRWASGGGTECCYIALYMRPQNDTRLASVYKPWARQQLLSNNNLQLVALVGDQFSDLNGEASAPYAFKLPNPFYYIL